MNVHKLVVTNNRPVRQFQRLVVGGGFINAGRSRRDRGGGVVPASRNKRQILGESGVSERERSLCATRGQDRF